MSYNKKTWRKRYRNRSDISTYVTHLTKGNNVLDAWDVLIKILKEKTLKAAAETSYVIGDNKVVCFQDMPIYGVCQNAYHEENNRTELGNKLRYNPIGVLFEKTYIFKKGGRPVIYEQKNKAKSIFPPEEWWRVVNFDLYNENAIIDWTHEREWRVKDDFHFDLKEAIIVVPSHSNFKFEEDRIGKEIFQSIKGFIHLDPVLS